MVVAVVSVRLVVRQRLLRCRRCIVGLAEQRRPRCSSLTGPGIVRLVLLMRVVMLRLHVLAVRCVLARSLQGVGRWCRGDGARIVVVGARVIGQDRAASAAVRRFQPRRGERPLLCMQRRRAGGIVAASGSKHGIALTRRLSESRRRVVQLGLISLTPLNATTLGVLVGAYTTHRRCRIAAFPRQRHARLSRPEAPIRIRQSRAACTQAHHTCDPGIIRVARCALAWLLMRVARTRFLFTMQVGLVNRIVDDLLQQLLGFPVVLAIAQFRMIVLESIDGGFHSVFGLLG